MRVLEPHQTQVAVWFLTHIILLVFELYKSETYYFNINDNIRTIKQLLYLSLDKDMRNVNTTMKFSKL